MPASASRVLPIIVAAQFLCTTLWFGGNAVLPGLSADLRLPSSALAGISSAVQIGFISGTLVYAILTIADRFAPSIVFLFSAILAAGSNLGVVVAGGYTEILVLRFLTGFFLAGIYPVGMKIAADYFDHGLGKALGFLVGALVLGTAFPHLVNSFSAYLEWQLVLLVVSACAIAGGVMMWLLVPPGPYRKQIDKPSLRRFASVNLSAKFRSAALGYFGHMWELYAFWAFLPLFIRSYTTQTGVDLPVSFTSFFVIAVGGLACVAGGYLAVKFSAGNTAKLALACSAACCLLSVFAFSLPPVIFIVFMLAWGCAVVADSPMFSTLVAQNAPAGSKGTALTFVTCIGFLITIFSIGLLGSIAVSMDHRFMFLFLAPGPLLGLLAMRTSGSRW